MSIYEEPESDDEPIILSLEAFREASSRPDDQPPQPTDDGEPKGDEAYWAGRNHAMRRSARWAA
jgi:hypothetical protein